MKILKFPRVAFSALGDCFASRNPFLGTGRPYGFRKGNLHHFRCAATAVSFQHPNLQRSSIRPPLILEPSRPTPKGICTPPAADRQRIGQAVRDRRTGKSRTFAELDGLEIHALAVDSNGQVFAATDPDGKVYKIGADGKPRCFYDPHQKYIWALAFNRKGDLFVATGDQGEIHRVSPDGQGSVFFKTEETHARSLAFDAQDNLIVGTEPGGLVLRVSPTGQGFVLYQAPKREITSVAVAKDGAIYAAGVGNKTLVPAPAPPSLPAPVAVSSGASGPSMTVISATRCSSTVVRHRVIRHLGRI